MIYALSLRYIHVLFSCLKVVILSPKCTVEIVVKTCKRKNCKDSYYISLVNTLKDCSCSNVTIPLCILEDISWFFFHSRCYNTLNSNKLYVQINIQ